MLTNTAAENGEQKGKAFDAVITTGAAKKKGGAAAAHKNEELLDDEEEEEVKKPGPEPLKHSNAFSA